MKFGTVYSVIDLSPLGNPRCCKNKEKVFELKEKEVVIPEIFLPLTALVLYYCFYNIWGSALVFVINTKHDFS